MRRVCSLTASTQFGDVALEGRGFPKMNWFAVTNNLSPTKTSVEALAEDTAGAELILVRQD